MNLEQLLKDTNHSPETIDRLKAIAAAVNDSLPKNRLATAIEIAVAWGVSGRLLLAVAAQYTTEAIKLDEPTLRLADAVRQLQGWVEHFSDDPDYRFSNRNMLFLLEKVAKAQAAFALIAIFVAELRHPSPDAARQLRQAHKGLNLFANLTERYGMYTLKTEIEDTAFATSKPEVYQKLKQEVTRAVSLSEKYFTEVQHHLQALLAKHQIPEIKLQARQKNLYSIYKKLNKKLSVDLIHDIIAMRIIVPDIDSCYEALSIINTHWQPVKGRIKDYIATPKLNGYRSLHTTVKALGNRLVEIQIRTPEMHQEAETGSASHFEYSQLKGSKAYQKNVQTAALQKLVKPAIYVFSPKGDLFNLKEDSIALDFAFAVHTSIGLRARAAKVNGKIAKLDSKLQDGDVVEIVTQKQPQANPNWLKVVKTAKAQNRIRQYLQTKS